MIPLIITGQWLGFLARRREWHEAVAAEAMTVLEAERAALAERQSALDAFVNEYCNEAEYPRLNMLRAALAKQRERVRQVELVIAMHRGGQAEDIAIREGKDVVKEESDTVGAWTREEHLRMSDHDEGLVAAIADLCHPRSVVDFGCGLGLYLARLHGLCGARGTGFEPKDMGVVYPGVTILQGDLTALLPVGQYDTALCLEVMEHIAIEYHDVAFDNICQGGEWLIFSGATPGQGGQGHVAERPEEEWRAEIEKRGWVLCDSETRLLREAAQLPWFKANVMCFKRERTAQ